MTGGDERFYAWLDGELSRDEAAAMEARVASDPELSRLAEEDRAVKARLTSAFGTVAEALVPAPLLDAARDRASAEIVDFGVTRDRREVRRTRLPQWMAMAASLAVGVLVGSTALNRSAGGPVTEQGGVLYAGADLEDGLNTQLASAPGGGAVRIGLTYRDRSGQICRTFTAAGSSGLACRNQGRWRLEAMVASGSGSSRDFRMASGPGPVVADLVASSISGEPFDASAERAAKARGWTG